MAPVLALEFADPWLALGAVLAAIPIILYLIERRRTPTVDWPALRFLLADLKRRTRWMQLKELLLIALRCLIIAAVVAALMRPGDSIVRTVTAKKGGTRGVVILLDNSWSMAQTPGDGGGPSAWDAARVAAAEIIEDLSPGDLVHAALLAGRPAALSPAPFRNLADARAALREAALGGGSASIIEGLDLAVDLARALPVARRDIYIITDLQDRGWSLRDRARWTFIRERLAALGAAPGLAIIDVGLDTAVNRAVTGIALGRSVAGTDRPVEIAAQVAQFGDPAARDMEAVLKIDGEERETVAAQVSGERPAVMRFRHRFAAPGPHRIEVILRGAADAIHEDDLRSCALEVSDRLAVLVAAAGAGLAGGGPGTGGDGDLIDLALAPRLKGESAPEVLFRPSVMDLEAFGRMRAADLAMFRVVVLADAPSIEPASAALLEDFVRAGGGLLIFAGAKAVPASYNADLFREGQGVLPARLSGIEGFLEAGSAAGEPASPGHFPEGHLAFAELGDGGREELGKVQVRRWRRTEPAHSSADAAVLADLRPGTPYILGKDLGRGRILLVVTGPRPDDSDLPRRPVFVPFLHGLCAYLAAGAEEERNVLLGGTIIQRLDGGDGTFTAEVEDPAQEKHPAAVGVLADAQGPGERPAARYGPAALPGFYTLRVKGPGGERAWAFAANLDPGESDLRRLAPADLEKAVGLLGFEVARKVGDLPPVQVSETVRRQWWRPLLAAAIALLLVEVIFTRALAKGRAAWRAPTGGKSVGGSGEAGS